MPTREQANSLMCEWVSSESLRKHMWCVEAAMRAYAKKYRGDEEMWGLAGLLHDYDYEKYPTYDVTNRSGHPFEGVRHLESLGYPKEVVEAILGHALYSGVPRHSQMAKCLFACDELCGFLVACAYMRPTKFGGLTYESVKKKLKDKKFAAKVSREDIALGIAEMGLSEEEHVNFVIGALQNIQPQIFTA